MVVDPLALTMMDNSTLRTRLQEKDAEIERLQTRVAAAYAEGWGDGITGCSFNEDWLASEARAALNTEKE